MLLSPQSIKLMSKGFIWGDFLGVVPFTWNSELERPELNLSRKRIIGCVAGFFVTVLYALVLTVRYFSRLLNDNQTATEIGTGNEKWKTYMAAIGMVVLAVSMGFQGCLALSYNQIPGIFIKIQTFSKSFTGLS